MKNSVQNLKIRAATHKALRNDPQYGQRVEASIKSRKYKQLDRELKRELRRPDVFTLP